MKKIYAAWVFLLVAAILIPACGPAEPDCAQLEVFCVGLVTDGGKIDDQSLNQAAWAGVQQAQSELGAQINYIETTDWKDYYKNISTFAEANYDVIVSVGFDLTGDTLQAATKYPNLYFIGVDQTQPEKIISNLASLSFPEDQQGFLAGALAALMSQSGEIGGVLPSDVFTHIWRFGEGYQAGAKYINPGIEVTLVYHNDVGSDKTFSDPEWGATTAESLVEQGVDVICSGGGTTGDGAVIAAAEKGVYAIGVDNDQYYSLPEARKMLLSSAVKLITPAVFDLIKLAKDGAFPNGNVYGKAGYAPFHNLNSTVPAEVKTRVEEIVRGLIDGSIKTNVPAARP